VIAVRRDPQGDGLLASPDRGDARLAQALAQLSDVEWEQLKREEERRRSDQRTIRDLATPLFLDLSLHRRRRRVLELDPVGRAPL
jgi:hypothetical protein